MKCERVQDLLPAYLESALGWFSRGRVDAHLSECSGCRSELRALQRTVELVRDAGVERAPRGLSAAVMARLPLAMEPAPRARVRRPLVLVPAALGAAAALLLSLPDRTPPPPAAAETNTAYVREYAHFHASQDIGGGTGAVMLATEFADSAAAQSH